jgi:hypothetical protein
LSSTHFTEKTSTERRLAALVVQAMDTDFELVSVALAGRKVCIHGTAPSYLAKARAADALRAAGYAEVENCLRVVPGLPVRH